MIFNKNTRTDNVIKISFISTSCNIVNIAVGFIYRSVFLHFLSSSYLGLNGLFSNIFSILSLSELGITGAITYRFYDPISKNDISKVAQLMNFLKKVYSIIITVITVFGLLFLPFLKYTIKNPELIPSDINLYLIYLLFLIQTLSSYLFTYKQVILSADQNNHIVSLQQTIVKICVYIFQIVILCFYKNYTLSLLIGIIMNLIINYIFSIWITNKYILVFNNKDKLTIKDQKLILQDTKANMLHKIGGTVLNSTDNIILSSFVGLEITGLYSNYFLITSSLDSMLNQFLGSFTSSFGNAYVELDNKQRYLSYRRLLFFNLCISFIVTVCLYCLINDFIALWLGKSMLLDDLTVKILCIQFYINSCRKINISFTNASGLFIKDKIRPIIEASLNLAISIILVIKLGISGIFLGTIISNFITVFWREPYILYKYAFQKSSFEYWKYYSFFTFLTIINITLINRIFSNLNIINILNPLLKWLLKASICFFFCTISIILLFQKNDDYIYLLRVIKNKVNNKLTK